MPQPWNPTDYAANGRFVATLATEVVNLLNPQPGEHILDAGCGDGALTQQLAATGANLQGVDASAEMVAAARARGLTVEHIPITELPYETQFDAVFSNACLHWIPRPHQPTALAAIHRALKPGGRFVAEMGGQGNIAAIRTALSAVLAPYGLDSEALAASFFPSPAHYTDLLTAAGFAVETISLHPRPTPVPGGSEGMARWLETFRSGVLNHLSPAARSQALDDIVRLLRPVLYDDQASLWTTDYVRLRFKATRPAK